ncbi:TPA: L-seryl-tRNA(Sec) selenium transferase [Photobacterium damselae]
MTLYSEPDVKSPPITSKPNFRLPQVEKLLQQAEFQIYIEQLSRPVVTDIIRTLFAKLRLDPQFQAQGVAAFDINQLVRQRCQIIREQRQQRVINATGIAVHTNLGRSPIHQQLWQQVTELNTSYSNLELKLSDGKRGQRNGLLSSLVHSWLGAEECVVVNNNAASIYLALHGLAAGKEVIVSRGEQIQIGGGFRIPDILALSGCTLVEVGTTNITTSDDYINAITENTAMVLMVHQSNFSMQGFTESPDISDVAKRLPEHIALVVDQGSGLSSESYAQSETALQTYLKMGADLVCFSGDKILGGPQAGIIAGDKALCLRLSKNPMMRAFRSSRIVLSLLEQLLIDKLNKKESGKGIAERTLQALAEKKHLAEQLAKRWKPFSCITELQMQVGGGSIPTETYPCLGLTLTLPGKAQQHLEALRSFAVPIIGYLNRNQLILNVATLLPHDMDIFIQQLDSYIAQFNVHKTKTHKETL